VWICFRRTATVYSCGRRPRGDQYMGYKWKSLPSVWNIQSSAPPLPQIASAYYAASAGCAPMIVRTNLSSLVLFACWPGDYCLHHQGARVGSNHHLPCKVLMPTAIYVTNLLARQISHLFFAIQLANAPFRRISVRFGRNFVCLGVSTMRRFICLAVRNIAAWSYLRYEPARTVCLLRGPLR